MTDFNELKELVKKKHFGTALYGSINGEPVYLSRGVREVFLGGSDEQKMVEAVEAFQKGQFGDAAEHGKSQKAGHEYGRYEIAQFEPTEEDTAVWVHKAEDAVIVYFKFER